MDIKVTINDPVNIGKVKIKNRYAMAPMAIGPYITPEGEFTPSGIDYFVRRAQGGFGLILTAPLRPQRRSTHSHDDRAL